MRFGFTAAGFTAYVNRMKARARADLRRASHIAVDRAGSEGLTDLRERMKSVGLGKLGQAVTMTSSLKKSRSGLPWAVIYARGKTNMNNRGAGAIQAYSRGALIYAKNVSWLAYPTSAVPKMVMTGGRRRRLTPDTYISSSLMSTLGPLEFRPIGNDMALLVAKKVTLSPKTGRAKMAGPRATRTRIYQDEVVVFVLIRYTERAKRFDEKASIRPHARSVPRFISEALASIRARRGG